MSEHADGVFWARWTEGRSDAQVFLIERRGREWCVFGREDYYLDEYVDSHMTIMDGPLSPQTPASDRVEKNLDEWRVAVRALCVRLCGEEVAQRDRWIADIEAAVSKQQRVGRPWIDNDKTIPELHVGGWKYDVRVCVGTDNVVEIDKFYGPLVARAVRVSVVPELDAWVVEREVDVDDSNPDPGTSAWVECARFPLDGDIR
jgi:hypothetical protein